MNRINLLDLSKKDKTILHKILNNYSKDFVFYAFGSRVTGKAKKYSDLDIAYEKIGNKDIRLIKDEIEESNLSITVDFVNLEKVDHDFEEIIRSHMIII